MKRKKSRQKSPSFKERVRRDLGRAGLWADVLRCGVAEVLKHSYGDVDGYRELLRIIEFELTPAEEALSSLRSLYENLGVERLQKRFEQFAEWRRRVAHRKTRGKNIHEKQT